MKVVGFLREANDGGCSISIYIMVHVLLFTSTVVNHMDESFAAQLTFHEEAQLKRFAFPMQALSGKFATPYLHVSYCLSSKDSK